MASEKDQAKAEVYRMQSEVESAKRELERVRRTEKEDRERGWDKVGPAKAALTHAERALDLAQDRLRRLS
jgi:hypothetical protein